MSDSSGEPWSNNPNAPQISSLFYAAEKYVFVGNFIGVVAYGIAVALFFQCIGALINPVNTMRKSVKWGLAAHTAALFAFSTTRTIIDQYAISNEYVNNRDFFGGDQFPPGPLGYDFSHFSTGPFGNIYYALFPLNQWLADGLFLYRCYVIFSLNHWIMVLPCLLYTASVVVGIMNVYYYSVTGFYVPLTLARIATAYFAISFSLNVLLTLMVIARLVQHRRNIQHAMGTSEATGLYTTIIIMLVESYALYAIVLLLYIIYYVPGALLVTVFSQLLVGIQVIAPYLVTLRVAERRAPTSEMITSGNIGSIRFRSQGTTDGGGSLPDHDPTSSTHANAEAPEEVCPRDENRIEEVPLRQDLAGPLPLNGVAKQSCQIEFLRA